MGQQPFETILEAHHAEIYRYLRRVTSRAAEADDLSQETFLRAYRAYRALPSDANVRAWLFTIATNLARNHFRSEGRRSRAHAAVIVSRSALDDGAGPEGAPGRSEEHTSELQSRLHLVCRLLLEKKKHHCPCKISLISRIGSTAITN